jgi:hypothetical protein
MRKRYSLQKALIHKIGLVSILLFLFGCASPASVSPTTTSAPTLVSTPTNTSTGERRADGLSADEVATLSSLEKIDDYPLYTMHYYGAYPQWRSSVEDSGSVARKNLLKHERAETQPAWACSLFAALGNEDNMLYGRNFDWEYSPAVLLFTDPPDGYASVSMVDIAYLGFGGSKASTLIDLPLIERGGLLNAPFLPFDGMNERGLVVGMAAVPPGQVPPDPNKETIDSLMVIRKILDQASTVDEAIAILKSYNITMGGGPPLHYLIASTSGGSVLVEFYQGEMVVIPNETTWHLATNFLRASVGESAEGECWRYDRIFEWLTDAGGQSTVQEAIDLLEDVSQEGTQWSVVYGMSTGDVQVIMGRQYENVYTFPLSFAEK